MLYLLYCIVFFLAKILPLRILYAAASLIARLYFMFSKKDKNALRQNLRIVLGGDVSPEIVDVHVLRVFINFAKYLADFFKLSRLSEDYILKNVELEGLHHIDQCLSEGKGIILLAIHLGNWELGAAVVAALGYPMNAIVLEHKDKRINDLFARQRAVNDVKAIPLGMQLKQCFQVLESNETLAIAGDKVYTGSGEYVEFFGKKALIPKGAAVLSLKTGTPIIFVILARKEDDTFKMQFEEPIRYEGTGDNEKDVKALMREYLAMFEKYIRQYPDQWYAFGEIWKQESLIQ